ncbi:MAG: bifunctional UDP-N-acetylglucosamine diphosphorylase/glucosamine-1-phosphate N-acetyltransferase GlmU [Clostridiales bacterium]|nr:bifunctional UDP-N-acetylglucosamine diphosphorylase/glucosamine-1-phosphate N-acetyltransferase GlmU [Clostridiales bacterium]
MNNITAVILAAGEGKRMKSNYSKVIHKVAGKPIIKRVCEAVKNAGIEKCVLVVGHKQEQVRETMGDSVLYAVQSEQLGTGHAVMQAIPELENAEKVVVLCGDAPLLSSDTLKEALKTNVERKEYATIFTAEFDDPTGYGRIVRDDAGAVVGIVEHKDATEEQRKIKEVNSSMYCFDKKALVEALGKLDNNNAQNEYYLTDVIKIMISEGKKVGTYIVPDKDEIMGINDREQLSVANEIARRKINKEYMKNGVTIIDTNTTYIDGDAKIGKDTIIYPGTILEGAVEIGENCTIGPNSKITNAIIGNDTQVINSVLIDCKVGNSTTVGPFAYLRPNSNIGDHARIGDFVEIKNSNIGNGTKVSHLTYVGDSDVGENVNFGCGTVTVNYDGINKHRTKIGNNSFIGCNTNLVAPVEVGDRVYTAAGTTVTKDVPDDALVIGRVRQEIKPQWTAGKIKGC